jgi:hypothetical protein
LAVEWLESPEWAGRMERRPRFGVLLARLADHQRLNLGDLSQLAQVPEAELRAVLRGMPPYPSLLRTLAPALNLHAADLFVIAGVPVPEELAPLDINATGFIPQLAGHAMRLPPESRGRLRQFVRSMPRHHRIHAARVLRVHEHYPPNFGALIVQMLDNRNLDWTSSAKTLFHLTGLYLAGATIGAIGHGRKQLSPDLMAGFATVLGIPSGGLAALTGMELVDQTSSQNPAAADVADLIWDIRHLTADQVRQIRDAAKSMRPE